ncbi:hypothetical protein AVEN_103607-1 [Araneus ventricosus]|uniref:Uncharacterized protein n=1 Tax=Araneus ventricosus TaxID=182803 RepID=A0A4Y2I7T2_ARAVE|nr:hypothetical protein AVEN_103607-1 [Araneus ventricosus]
MSCSTAVNFIQMRFYFLLALAACVMLLVVQAEGKEAGFRSARKIRQSDGGDTVNLEICLLKAGVSLDQIQKILAELTG